MGFSRQEYRSGLLFPSPGDLLNPGSNGGLPHCRQMIYPLSHQGNHYGKEYEEEYVYNWITYCIPETNTTLSINSASIKKNKTPQFYLKNTTQSEDLRCLSSKKTCLQFRKCGLDPWVRKSTSEGNDNPLQYSCLGNPLDRGAWWATGHGLTKNWTQLKIKQQQQPKC